LPSPFFLPNQLLACEIYDSNSAAYLTGEPLALYLFQLNQLNLSNEIHASDREADFIGTNPINTINSLSSPLPSLWPCAFSPSPFALRPSPFTFLQPNQPFNTTNPINTMNSFALYLSPLAFSLSPSAR
jgi:hypothetical protein